MHCDPWVWQGPFRHWSGETQWPQRKAIFLYHGDLICNDTNRVLTYHLRLLSCGYFDGHKIDFKKRRWFFCLFLPSHCDLNMLKATSYLCKSEPCFCLWESDLRSDYGGVQRGRCIFRRYARGVHLILFNLALSSQMIHADLFLFFMLFSASLSLF